MEAHATVHPKMRHQRGHMDLPVDEQTGDEPVHYLAALWCQKRWALGEHRHTPARNE